MIEDIDRSFSNSQSNSKKESKINKIKKLVSNQKRLKIKSMMRKMEYLSNKSVRERFYFNELKRSSSTTLPRQPTKMSPD